MDELKNKLTQLSDRLAQIPTRDWLKIVLVLLGTAFALHRCLLPFRAEYAAREAAGYEAQAGAQHLSPAFREAALLKAIEKYRKILRLAPWETFYHTNLGRIYENKARSANSREEKLYWLDKAEEIRDLCLKISPKSPWYVLHKSDIYLLRAELEEDVEKIAELLNKREQSILLVGQLDPNNAIFQMQVAGLHMNRGELDKAEERYKHVLVIDESMGDAYMNLAEIYRRRGDTEQQMEMYRLAIEKSPSHRNARLNLGIMHEEQGRLSEAIVFYRGEVALDRTNEYAFWVLGRAFHRDEQWENMETAFNRLTMISPNNTDYYLFRAQAQIRQNKIAEALRSLESAQTLRPDDAQIRRNINHLRSL